MPMPVRELEWLHHVAHDLTDLPVLQPADDQVRRSARLEHDVGLGRHRAWIAASSDTVPLWFGWSGAV